MKPSVISEDTLCMYVLEIQAEFDFDPIHIFDLLQIANLLTSFICNKVLSTIISYLHYCLQSQHRKMTSHYNDRNSKYKKKLSDRKTTTKNSNPS